MKLIGKDKKLTTIISAYQVCARPTYWTGTTAYHQQESLLRQRGAKKAKPIQFFYRNLKEFIRLSKSRHESIILVGDFNESMNERSSIARIVTAHGLIDILFQRNSHVPEPHTYARGSIRIDYALISPDLVTSVNRCGYKPFHKRVHSDHRGMFLDFDTTVVQSKVSCGHLASQEFGRSQKRGG
jgi:endonuclease/exonuclease/phosphatase family metal-dependent hydrolase